MTTPTSPSVDTGATQLSGRAWATLLVLCGAIFLDALDVSMIGVALPSIRTDLDMSTSSLQWVVSGYVLGYGGFLLLGGRAADLFGRRRMFIVSLAVFLVASGLGGLANDGNFLIAMRFIKGVSAAFTAPAGLSIITTSFAEGPSRNKALLVYTATGATGFSLGLVFSGLLTEVGWRWTLLMPVPLSLITLIAAWRLIPNSGRESRPAQSFDIVGALGLSAMMLLLVFTVVEAPAAGWLSTRTLGSLAGVAALLIAFVALELRSTSPLVRLGILRSASLVRANLGAMALFGSWVGFQFIVVLYMQQLRGWSALETGLAIFPGGLMVALLSTTLTPRLVGRFGVAPVILAGMIAMGIAYGLFLPIGANSDYAVAMLPTFLLVGLGVGLAFGPLNIAATNGIAPQEQGLAGGLVNTSFQFGGALFLAITTAVNDANVGTGESSAALLDGFRAALIVPVIAAVLGAGATALGLLPFGRRAPVAQREVSEPRTPVSLPGLRESTLWSPDVSKLLPFYRDLLRIPVAAETPDFVVLGHNGGPTLSLGTRKDLDGRSGDPHRFSLGLDSEDLHSDLHRLRAAGVDVLEPPPDVDGLKYATLVDPEGNVVRLYQRNGPHV